MSLPSLAGLSLHDLQPSPAPTATDPDDRAQKPKHLHYGGGLKPRKPRDLYYKEGPKPESKPKSSKEMHFVQGKDARWYREELSPQCAPDVDVRFGVRGPRGGMPTTKNASEQPIDLEHAYRFTFNWTGVSAPGATTGPCQMEMVAKFCWSTTTTPGPMWHDAGVPWVPFTHQNEVEEDAGKVKLMLYIQLLAQEGLSDAETAHWSLEIPLVSQAHVLTALRAESGGPVPYFDLNKFLDPAVVIPFFSNNYKWRRGNLCAPVRHVAAMFAMATDRIVDFMLLGRVVELHDHAIVDSGVDDGTFVRAFAKAMADHVGPRAYADALGLATPLENEYTPAGDYQGVDADAWTQVAIVTALPKAVDAMVRSVFWRAHYYESRLGANVDNSELVAMEAALSAKLLTRDAPLTKWLTKAQAEDSSVLRELVERTMRRAEAGKILFKEETQLSAEKEEELVTGALAAIDEIEHLAIATAEYRGKNAGRFNVPFKMLFGEQQPRMDALVQLRKQALGAQATTMKVRSAVEALPREQPPSNDGDASDGSDGSGASDDGDDVSDVNEPVAQPGRKTKQAQVCRRRKVGRGQYVQGKVPYNPNRDQKPDGPYDEHALYSDEEKDLDYFTSDSEELDE